MMSPDHPSETLAELGTPIAEFKARATHFFLWFILGAIALAAGVGFMGLTVHLAFGPWPGPGNRWGALARGAFISAFVLAIAVAMLLRAFKIRGRRLIAFADALAFEKGNKTEVFRWDEIISVARVKNVGAIESVLKGAYQLILQGPDERRLELNESLSPFKELRCLVEEKTLAHLLPAALEAYEDGQTISFGQLSVSWQGLHYQSDTLPWDKVAEIQIGKGMVTVHAVDVKKPAFEVAISNVPNCHVLLALAHQI
jgi:hypothetical protein